MIDTSRKIRNIIKDEPLFGEFLKKKGFPLNINSPVTLVVSFDDVAKRRGPDKKSFLTEFECWQKNHKNV